MEFWFFIGFIIIFVSHVRLRGRVEALEEKLRRGSLIAPAKESDQTAEHKVVTVNEPVPIPPSAATNTPVQPSPVTTEPIPIPIATTPSPIPPAEPEPFFLYEWFKEQTFIKIGSILLFLGAVWFVSYAIDQNWIDPFTRILLGLLLAVAIQVGAFLLAQVRPQQFQVLTALGSGVLFATVVASQFAFLNPVLHPSIAFTILVIGVIYTAGVAVWQNTQWLAMAAQVAGLLVPTIVGAEAGGELLLLLYVFLLSAGFLSVVFTTRWRGLALVGLAGAAWYLFVVAVLGTHDTLVWFFTVLFSVLFLAAATISVLRTRTVTMYDATLLGVTALQFVLYAVKFALVPELALFLAALATAGIGYVLRMRDADPDATTLYAGLSIVFVFIGTTMLFDGFVLTIALALESLIIFQMSLRVATVIRTVNIAAFSFLLPVASGLGDLADPAWEDGLFHAPALGTLTVLTVLVVAALSILVPKALRDTAWLHRVAGSLLALWYVFAFIAAVTVDTTHPIGGEDMVFFIFSMLLASLFLISVALTFVRTSLWYATTLATLLFPTFFSLGLFTSDAWDTGILHTAFLTTLVVMVVLWSVVIGLVGAFKKTISDGTAHVELAHASTVALWGAMIYCAIFAYTCWDAVLPATFVGPVTTVTWMGALYLIIAALFAVRFPLKHTLGVLIALIPIGLAAVPALDFSGWSDGIFSIDAISLYFVTTILVLLGINTLQYPTDKTEERDMLQVVARVLFGAASALGVMLVWMVNHTIFAERAVATSIALFIYTVAGLGFHTYGRIHEMVALRRTGVLLLALVITRLALVDVWDMDPVWRIITFFGIGLLFIVTALLERSSYKQESVQTDVSEQGQ